MVPHSLLPQAVFSQLHKLVAPAVLEIPLAQSPLGVQAGVELFLWDQTIMHVQAQPKREHEEDESYESIFFFGE